MPTKLRTTPTWPEQMAADETLLLDLIRYFLSTAYETLDQRSSCSTALNLKPILSFFSHIHFDFEDLQAGISPFFHQHFERLSFLRQLQRFPSLRHFRRLRLIRSMRMGKTIIRYSSR